MQDDLRVCQAALTASLIWEVILQKKSRSARRITDKKRRVVVQPARLYMRIVAKIVVLTTACTVALTF